MPIYRILKFFRRYICSQNHLYSTIICRFKNLDAYIAYSINIIGSPKNIIVGKASSIGNFCTFATANQDNYTSKSKIIIGKNNYIGEYNNFRAANGSIIIGDNCLISQHITLVTSNHEIKGNCLINKQKWSVGKNSIRIEDDVWIGANVVVLPGITIHKGAVIGAGSIVTKDIPSYAVVVGNPSRIIKYRKK